MSVRKKEILVSVVMNCYNSGKYLSEAIDSVYSQTYTNWEIIFFDNASSDNSAKIAKTYNSKLRYIKNKKTVPLYKARNLAVTHCAGDAVAFLDCDDYWDKTKLEKQVELFLKSMTLIYCNYYTVDASSKIISKKDNKLLSGKITNSLFRKNFISIGCVLIAKKILEENRFEESLDLLGDFDLWLRISKKYHIIALNESLEYSRIHGNNLSNVKKDKWHSERRLVYCKYLNIYDIAMYPYLLIYILKTEIKGILNTK